MDEIQNLKRTGDVILNKTIDVEFDIVKPTLIEKIRNKKVRVFKVRRACLDTLLLFSNLTLDIITESSTEKKTLAEHLKAISCDVKLTVTLIAILLLNTNELPVKKLEKWLLRNLDNEDFYKTLVILVDHSRIENFLNSIILLKGMSLLKTEEMIAFENIVSGMLSED
ncbi:hypothetical protein [Pedobacter sp. Leaf132]|uniref:hypothetical protein n=1 Tax=Pedobacter sp. Leaf132 TaxID=2876557 RepID=UPI001E61C17F|nr:hypothetical protein [Pedobacter sp. Leaf132]